MSRKPGDPAAAARTSSHIRKEPRTVSHPTWAVVLSVLLFVACFYMLHGLRFEFFTVGGRPGAGFFPRVVGISLMASILYVLVTDWKSFGPTRAGLHRWTATFFGLAGALLIAGITILGASVTIALYLFATLTILNPGRHLANVGLSIAVPLAIRLLFDVWLGAPLPEGILFTSH